MIFIDPPLWPGRQGRALGRIFSHLVSDTSFEELHGFAERLQVPRRAFERDHYDIPSELYDRAVRLGAAPIGCQELIRRLNASGLRRPKHPRPPGSQRPAAR
jgi:hypothetical protein